MKKIIVLIILGMIVVPSAMAWDDCPYGLVDDPYPGECPRYVDTDDDGLCDHSQLAPEDRVVTEEVVEVDMVKIEADMEADLTVTPSESPEKKPIKKLFPVIKLVLAHIAGILVYVRYRKYRLGKS